MNIEIQKLPQEVISKIKDDVTIKLTSGDFDCESIKCMFSDNRLNILNFRIYNLKTYYGVIGTARFWVDKTTHDIKIIDIDNIKNPTTKFLSELI